VVRGSIVVERASDIPGVLDAARAHGILIAERPTNRVASPLDGYEDVALKIRMPSGVVAELQVLTREVAVVKMSIGHDLYNDMRRIRENPPSAITPEMRRELERLSVESRRVYTRAARLSR
jgi:hypothetical protein